LPPECAVMRPQSLTDKRGLFSNHTVIVFVPWHALRGLRNRSIRKTVKYRSETTRGRTEPDVCREKLEELSLQFHTKYLLAVMNSSFAREFVNNRRQSKHDVYPEDWKQLPIAPAAPEEQRNIVVLVDDIIALREKRLRAPQPDTSARLSELEQEIDDRVATLYGRAGSEKALRTHSIGDLKELKQHSRVPGIR
jgi:hypothetical protein